MNRTLTDFVRSVEASGLLAADDCEALARRCAAPGANPKAVARWAVQQKLLTAFQVKMLWNGRGPELCLGQYILVDKLGEGGMGEVFRARHRRMHREVALKIIRPERLDHPEAIRRFQREVQLAASLSHENVVIAYDADQQGDTHFFAMELVEGVNLAQKVRDGGPLSAWEACEYIRQAALGLQHAHERGLIHRDIKPSNLLLTPPGVVKLLDLGLARIAVAGEAEPETRITQEGLTVGTPDYISPEQARDARKADARSDLYSLGCTFYYLLAGEPPYPAGTPTEKMLAHSAAPIPDIGARRADLPASLTQLIHRMMAKNPDDRFASLADVATLLAPYTAGGPGSATRPALRLPPPVPTAEAATDSHFRITPRDAQRIELNPLYQPRNGAGTGWVLLVVGGLLLLGGLVLLWLLVRS